MRNRNKSSDYETVGPMSFPYEKKLGKISDDEAFDMVYSRFGDADHARDSSMQSLHKSWYVNLANFINLQGGSGFGGLFDDQSDLMPATDIYSANHMMRHVMFQVARLAGVSPTWDVIPMSTDPDDMLASGVAESLLKHLEDVQGWDKIRFDAAFWAVITGTGLIMSDWDSHIGVLKESFQNPFDASPEHPASEEEKQQLRNMNGARSKRTGDLTKCAISPYQLTVPNGVRTLETAPWIVVEEELDPGDIWLRYPKHAKKLVREDFEDASSSFQWKRISNLVNNYGGVAPTVGSSASELVTVRSLYIPPSGWCPKGKVIRTTRTQLLEQSNHLAFDAGFDVLDPQFRHMRFPVKKYNFCSVPGRFWGMGLAENLIGPQKQYNKSSSQFMDQQDRLGAPQWLTKRNSEFYTKGDVFEYSGDIKPELVAAPPLGSAQMASSQQSLMDMRSISSQSDASMGDNPSGIRSGNAVAMLQEKDDMSSQATLIEMKSCYRDLGCRDLALAWKLMDEERMIQIVGEAEAGTTVAFKGSMLGGNVFIRIEPSSVRFRSRAASIELANGMIQAGVLDPLDPRQKEAYMNAIEYKNADFLFVGMRKSRRRAKQENVIFMRPAADELTGQLKPFPAVEDHDDHGIHMEEHLEFMRSDIYENMPPVIKMGFQAHVMNHEEHIAAAMNAQAMMQGGMGQGGSQPAPVGEASQPRPAQPAAQNGLQ